MKTLTSILAFGMIMALAFSVSEAEAKRQRAASCRGIQVNCRNTGNAMNCLQCNAYHEAVSEGLAGMTRVSRVVMTRAASGQYPRNICSVIYQKWQFSWTPRPRRCVSASGWAKAGLAAQTALRSKGNGKLYFHADYVRPRWSRYCVGREKPRGDTHIYYSQCFRTKSQLARYQRQTRGKNFATVDSPTTVR